MRKTLFQTLVNLKLIQAAAAGRIEDLRKLLRDGADVNAVENSGTALIAATAHNRAAAVTTLIEFRAQVDLTDAQGNTALSHALHHRHTDIARLLVQSGADLNTRNMWGDTALTVAARAQDQQMVEQLIAFQADVNVTNTLGQSALMLAASHQGIVHSLLIANASLAHAANNNAVLSAILGQKPELAYLLLFAGATPNAVDWTGKAALTHAVDQGNAGLVRCLIAAKADPNQGANQHALASALKAPDPALLQALLDARARPDIGGQAGEAAAICAFALGNADAVARWFPANSAPEAGSSEGDAWNPLALAVTVGTAEIVAVLRDAGFSSDITDERGYSLLMLASYRGQPELVAGLLQPRNGQPGASPNAVAHSDGKTALMYAAHAHRADAMKILLAAGANPNAVDSTGHTAMDYTHRCTDPEQRNEMEFILAEAMAARALEVAGLPQRAYTSLADFLEMQDEAAADADARPDGRDQQAWVDWSDTMNDIDDCPVDVALGSRETPSLLPYHII